MTSKTILKKKTPPLEAYVQDYDIKETDDLDISKLDIFALFASSAVAKKMDDPVRIAHESYQIAHKMHELSEFYKEK